MADILGKLRRVIATAPKYTAILKLREIKKDIPEFVEIEFLIDESSMIWTTDPFQNKNILIKVEQMLDGKLESGTDKISFANLLEALEFPDDIIEIEYLYIGWKKGHGRVNLGLFDISDEQKRAFVNGLEPNVYLKLKLERF